MWLILMLTAIIFIMSATIQALTALLQFFTDISSVYTVVNLTVPIRQACTRSSQAQLPYVLLYLCSTFLSAVSQVLLKKAALREHKSVLAEYTDWRVILGYALFVGCTLLTMLAYKGVPLNVGPVLEATGYIYVTIFGVTIFHEKMNPKKLAALAMILVGILVYAL